MGTPGIVVVGIGADGWPGLPTHSRAEIAAADVVVGGRRHLDLLAAADVAADVEVSPQLLPLPSPLREGLAELVARYDGQRVVVLGSGDPMVSGIGTTLVELLGTDAVTVHPAVSSVALARARMGWSAESCDVVTLVGRDVEGVRRYLSPGRRLVVLSSDATTPSALARILTEAGLGASRLTVLSDLGSAGEARVDTTAAAWSGAAPALNLVCLVVLGGPAMAFGLPDDAFEHDGQLTKRDLRVSALSRLAPVPGQLLWDVGAGAGSVAIEWLRADPRNRAVAVEADPARAERIGRNARALGVPSLAVVPGRAPAALAGLPAPDAVFVGGGATAPGALDRCWEALATGGRLVVHAVTLETERVVIDACARWGGELTRISVEHAAPIGTFTGWTPARAVVQWAATKIEEPR